MHEQFFQPTTPPDVRCDSSDNLL